MPSRGIDQGTGRQGEEPCRWPGTPPGGRGRALPQTGLFSPAHGQREGTRVCWAARPSPWPASLFPSHPSGPRGGGGSSVSGTGLAPNIKKVCLPACWSQAGPPRSSALSHSHQNSPDGRRVRGRPREAAVGSSAAGPRVKSVASMGLRVTLAGGAGSRSCGHHTVSPRLHRHPRLCTVGWEPEGLLCCVPASESWLQCGGEGAQPLLRPPGLGCSESPVCTSER